MNAELVSLAQRFARLTVPKRRLFLERLQGEGLDFAALPIVPRDPTQEAPLARAQRALWLAWHQSPQSAAYNLSGRLTLRGALHPAQVEAGVRRLVERHAALRTAFVLNDDGQPIQRVLPATKMDWSHKNWAGTSGSQGEAMAEHAQHFALQPFDLERGEVFRAELHSFTDGVMDLLLSVHHIAADGSSVELLMAELVQDLMTPGSPPDRPSLAISYADYATWQHHWLEAGEEERQLAWWQSQLAGLPATTRLPLDRARRHQQGAHGALQSFRLEADVSAAMLALARQHAASPYMVTVALLNLLLARFCGDEDICIGLPTVNRGREELDGVVGHFTNVLPLRTRVDAEAGFLPLLLQVRDGLLEAKRHADLPLDLLVERLAVERQPGVHPFFQVKCAQQASAMDTGVGQGLQVEARALLVDDIHFDLSLDVTVERESLRFDLAYATELFDADTIERLVRAFQALAAQVVADPHRALGDLALPDAASVLTGEVQPVALASILELWTKVVARSPDATALTQADQHYTYQQVDDAATQGACALRALGVGREDRVAICLERSPAFVLALLSTLKVGGAFVPMDPAAPVSRREQLLKEAGAAALFSTPEAESWARGIPVLQPSLDACSNAAAASLGEVLVHPAQAAYLIFTSGSTGRPKGVVVSHGALANYVQGLLTRMALPPGASFAMVSTVAADLGHTSLFGALCSGGALHLLAPDEAFDADAFAARMKQTRAAALKIVPSHLRGLLNAVADTPHAADVLPSRLLVLGGEAADQTLLEQVRALRPDLHILNHYGPTETTVGVLTQALPPEAHLPTQLPLGRPLPNLTAYVLDERLQPVQPGMTGELFMGGPALARGYAGQPGLTASRFVASPLGDHGIQGARLYRTGDQVRLGRDGALHFLGRQDDQIKIRGFRVEPGELQAVLRAWPQVADAFVMAGRNDAGTTELWAYVVPTGAMDLDLPALRAHLHECLPAHLMPAALVPLGALPLNANGKVDRRGFPAPSRSAQLASDMPGPTFQGQGSPDHNSTHEPRPKPACRPAPRDPAEGAIATLWAELLGLPADSIRREDSFFGLGGDSILSLKLMTRLRRTVPGGDRLSLATVMRAPHLGALADALRQGVEAAHDAVRLSPGPSADAAAEAGLPLYCVPGMIVNTREFEPLARALGSQRAVHAFVSHVYTPRRWRGFAMADLADDYARYITATAVDGRCALLGWSSGGDLTHELVHRLQGRVDVRFVGMVDVFETEPLRPQGTLTDEQRSQGRASIEAWLGRSTMADAWRGLIDRMDAQEWDGVIQHALREESPLPLDGTDEDAQEYLLWVTLDKRVQAVRYAYPPSEVPLQVYHAEDSLTSDGRLREWAAHAPVAGRHVVAGSNHLSIIRSPGFLDALALHLSAADRA
ncbi:amino acid adenylation domain-containing protein [Roseateles sp. SL47]|uniref:amino acid adenylation domain-containing protein n=1 Tax=Roseateles sp. SL47 TaxID=2995138 RepID=UPI00226F0098|nr:amino acid adenylation domain-containing protein [Roseateles sp. SL47]WAC71653.1 amino acid adenylation domain-containing protein [Roseateles sp. SL47]